MNEFWFALEVIGGCCAIVGIGAVLLDRRQRRYQRTYLDQGPSIKDCARNYTP